MIQAHNFTYIKKIETKIMRKITAFLIIYITCSLTILSGQKIVETDTFSFSFEGKKLSGFIDMPQHKIPSTTVIIIPGHGATNFGEKNWLYDTVISNFTEHGFACLRWDRAGCGSSEGSYNHQQTAQSSANEIIAAINELKRRNISGSENIGLWGISRAGYICPLAIQQYPSIKFWISVSGTDGLNSGDYMFESHLRLAGRSESQAKLLIEEYKNGGIIFENGGTYEEFMKAQEHFRIDSLCVAYLGGEITEEGYYREQASILGNIPYKRDEITKSIILVPNFKNILNEIHCPVLGIFGEKDSQVDWRRTMILYQETIGNDGSDKLTIKTFPDGNHVVIKCQTGASNEYIEKIEFCDGYIETMTVWLIDNEFVK